MNSDRQSFNRSQEYLDFIRRSRCAVTGRDSPCHAHHVRIGNTGGTSLKPSDYRAIPLSGELHTELHLVGEKSFWEKYKIDPEIEISKNLIMYALQKQINIALLNYSMENVIHELS